MKRFEDSNEAQAFLDKLVCMVNDERLYEYLQSTDKNYDTKTVDGLTAMKGIMHKIYSNIMMAE